MRKWVFVYALAVLLTVESSALCADFIPFREGASSNEQVNQVLTQTENGINLHIQFSGFIHKQIDIAGVIYDQISIQGCGIQGEDGDPAIPFKSVFLEIPVGIQIELQQSISESLFLTDYFIVPNHFYFFDHVTNITPKDSIYQSSNLYPTNVVQIIQDGMMRGKRVIQLSISPIQFNPAGRCLQISSDLNIFLKFNGTPDPSAELNAIRLSASSYQRAFSKILMNYHPDNLPDLSAGIDGCNYLILTPSQWSESLILQEFIQWKTKKGYQTTLISIQPQDAMFPDVIKGKIHEQYNLNPSPEYVLLLGDYEQLTSFTLDSPSDTCLFPTYVSDFPYSLMNEDDEFSDVIIGRLPVTTLQELESSLIKILKYDRIPDIDDWYRSALLAAAYLDLNVIYVPDCHEDTWGYETVAHIFEYMYSNQAISYNQFNFATCADLDPPFRPCSYLYCRDLDYPHRPPDIDGNFRADDFRLTCDTEPCDPLSECQLWESHVGEEFNKGNGIVLYIGHGDPNGWSSIPFTIGDVQNDLTSDYTPLILSMSCLTGRFNESDCWAEEVLKAEGGAICIFAASNETLVGPTELFTRGIYTSFFPDYDNTYQPANTQASFSFGESLLFAREYKQTYLHDHISKYENRVFHCFGDPEVMLRTDIPVTPQIPPITQFYSGVTRVVIAIPLEKALVAVSQGGVLLGSNYSSNGVAEIDLRSRLTSGTATIVVTGYNLFPLEISVPVVQSTCGSIVFNESLYTCDENSIVTIELTDTDLNRDDTCYESISVNVQSYYAGRSLSIDLTETQSSSGIFTGTFEISSNPDDENSLYTMDQDVITVTYYDDTCDNPDPIFMDTADIDCDDEAAEAIKPFIYLGGYCDAFLKECGPNRIAGRMTALAAIPSRQSEGGGAIVQAGLTMLPDNPHQVPQIIWPFTQVQAPGYEYLWTRGEEIEIEMEYPVEDRYAFGMASIDSNGWFSDHWPYLEIRAPEGGGNSVPGEGESLEWLNTAQAVPGATPDIEEQAMLANCVEKLQDFGATPGEKPIIWAAGYMDTNLIAGTPGQLKIAAIVTKPTDGQQVDKIVVYRETEWPTYLEITTPYASLGDFEIYYQTYNIVSDVIMPPKIFGLKAHCSEAVSSDLWPYIEVQNIDETTPLPAPIITANHWNLAQCEITIQQSRAIEIDSYNLNILDLEIVNPEPTVINLGRNTDFYIVENLEPCHKYSIWLDARDVCGTVRTSNVINGVTSELEIPRHVYIDQNRMIHWTMNDPGDDWEYIVYAGSSSDPDLMIEYARAYETSAHQPSSPYFYFAISSYCESGPFTYESCRTKPMPCTPPDLPTGIQEFKNLDVSMDGHPDIIGKTSRGLQIYFGLLDGGWLDSGQLFTGRITDFDICDFNQDDAPDLVIVETVSIRSYINDGAGFMINSDNIFTEGLNQTVKTEDTESKGTSDVVVGNSEGTIVKITDENGGTQDLQMLESGDTKALGIADLNGDGIKEIVTGTEAGNNVIWAKDEIGAYREVEITIDTWSTHEIRIEDANADGCTDIVIVELDGWETVFYNDCEGSFE